MAEEELVVVQLNPEDRKLAWMKLVPEALQAVQEHEKLFTEADKMLLLAKTPEETKEALKMGARVNVATVVPALSPEAPGHLFGLLWDWMALQLAETPEQTEILIKAGAYVNARTRHGTALTVAKTEKQAMMLLRAGADERELSKNNILTEEQKAQILELWHKEKDLSIQNAGFVKNDSNARQ